MTCPSCAGEPYAVTVPDLDSVFLAVACENYAAADLAVWKVRTALGLTTPTPAERGQLDALNSRRMAAYTDLVLWVDRAETARIMAQREPAVPDA